MNDNALHILSSCPVSILIRIMYNKFRFMKIKQMKKLKDKTKLTNLKHILLAILTSMRLDLFESTLSFKSLATKVEENLSALFIFNIASL